MRQWPWAVYLFSSDGKLDLVVSAPNYWFSRSANIVCLTQKQAEYHAEQIAFSNDARLRLIQADGTSIWRDFRTSIRFPLNCA